MAKREQLLKKSSKRVVGDSETRRKKDLFLTIIPKLIHTLCPLQEAQWQRPAALQQALVKADGEIQSVKQEKSCSRLQWNN